MRDMKREVSATSSKRPAALCGTFTSRDLTPHIPALVHYLADPTTVPVVSSCSRRPSRRQYGHRHCARLSRPRSRMLSDRSTDVQRRTVVVIDNLGKLVRAAACRR
jgi:elongation factor 3